MQVPHDLAIRIAQLARTCGQSPESLLREAISQWIEAFSAGLLEDPAAATNSLHPHFVPQPCGFSVYE